MGKRISLFLKFGHLAHLEAIRNGFLFMQPLSYFQKNENDPAFRFDNHEGLQSVLQPDNVTISIGIGTEIHELKDLAGPVLINRRLGNVHAFCLYSLSDGDYEVEDVEDAEGFRRIVFDKSFRNFGGHVLSISPPQLIERVKKLLIEQKINARMGPVTYINETEHQSELPTEKLGFYKLSKYSHQHEYRFLVSDIGLPNEPLLLNIGDLSDISEIFAFEKLDIRFKKNISLGSED